MKLEFPLRLMLLSLLLFLAGFTAGYLKAEEVSGMTEILSEELASFFELPPPLMASAIFANNLVKTLLAMLLGIFLAIPPILFMLVNGFILGVVGFQVISNKGVAFLILGVLPHGVLELFAAVLSAALGIRLGGVAYAKLRNRSIKLWETVKFCLKTYLLLGVPSLAAAALIETYITPLLLTGF